MTRAGKPDPVELRLPADPNSVAVARHAASRFAQESGADASAVALAISETVTNAIMHGHSDGTGEVEVTAQPNGGEHIVVTVTDNGPGMRPNPDSPGLGYGLSMVGSLAEEVAIRSPENGGTSLRMRFRTAG
jgi:anti-sigma regulatory factor (Ser/Thr protein kinase)